MHTQEHGDITSSAGALACTVVLVLALAFAVPLASVTFGVDRCPSFAPTFALLASLGRRDAFSFLSLSFLSFFGGAPNEHPTFLVQLLFAGWPKILDSCT